MNNQKKICFVVPRAYSFLNKNVEKDFGGSEKQAALLAKSLATDSKYSISFCVADYHQSDYEIIDNIHVYKAITFKNNILQQFRQLSRFLKEINADYYVFRAANKGLFFLCLYIKYFLRKKTIYMMASDTELKFNDLCKLFDFQTALLMNLSYRFFDKITVQSNDQLLGFKKKYSSQAKIVRNAFVADSEIFDNNNLRNSILWVGRCIEIKQPEIYIKLANDFPTEHFIMICQPSFDLNYWAKIRALALQSPNIQFIESVSPEKIMQHYWQAKIFVITSESEGFANTMMEAMYARCAVNSLNINPDRIITANNLGLIAACYSEFCSNFNKLLINKQLRETCGQNAARYIKENHNIDTVIKQFKDVIEK